jgi:methyl halide transferase
MKKTQTDWQTAYESRETPWEKGVAHPALVDFLAANGPLARDIFVPGCGSGNDVRALSTRENHVVGVDLAPFAVEKARANPRVGNEEYLLADLFTLPAQFDGKFDVAFEHTCFCAINPALRADYARAIARLLKPGGQFLAIFFLNPDLDEGEEGPPFPVSAGELESVFGPYFTLEREWVPQRTHPGREGRELMRVLKRTQEPSASHHQA